MNKPWSLCCAPTGVCIYNAFNNSTPLLKLQVFVREKNETTINHVKSYHFNVIYSTNQWNSSEKKKHFQGKEKKLTITWLHKWLNFAQVFL